MGMGVGVGWVGVEARWARPPGSTRGVDAAYSTHSTQSWLWNGAAHTHLPASHSPTPHPFPQRTPPHPTHLLDAVLAGMEDDLHDW